MALLARTAFASCLAACPLLAQVGPVVPPPPSAAGVAVERIEASQGIQNPANLVPLLGGRETWIRVYIASPAQAGRVRGRLRVTAPRRDTILSSVAAVDAGVAGDPLRLESTLNFVLPASAAVPGSTQLEVVELRREADDAVVGCANCATRVLSRMFHAPTSLRLRVVGFRYTRGGRAYAPRLVDFEDIRSWLTRAYPVSTLQMDTVTVSALSERPACRTVGLALARLRAIELASGADPGTHYFGLVRDAVREHGDSGFMIGCTLGTPPWPDPATVASGPAGSPTDIGESWDDLPSYAGWYTGHEVAHTLGRRHPGFCDNQNGSPEDPGLPPESGKSIDTPPAGYVGLDPQRGRVYDGELWRDVMTYCDRRWISAYTYQGLLARLREEAAVYPPAVGTDLLAVGQPAGDSILEVIGSFDDLQGGEGSIAAAFGTWRRGRPAAFDSVLVANAPPDHLAVVEVAYGDSSRIRYPVVVIPRRVPMPTSGGGELPSPQGGGWVRAYVPNFPGGGSIRLLRDGIGGPEFIKPAAPARLTDVRHVIERAGGVTDGHGYSWTMTDDQAATVVYVQANLDEQGWRVLERTRRSWISFSCAFLQGHRSARIRLVVADQVHTYLAYEGEPLILPQNDPCRSDPAP